MEFLEHGGWVLKIIFLLSFCAWFVIVLKWSYLKNETEHGLAWIESVIPALRQGDLAEARSICSNYPGLGERMITGLIEVRENGKSLTKRYRRKITEREQNRLRRYMDIITVSSAVLPLLGLLGTVLGMTATFRGLTIQDYTEAHAVMAEGISRSLVTTQAGLAAALPILLMYGVLAALIRRRIDEGLHAVKRIETVLSKEQNSV